MTMSAMNKAEIIAELENMVVARLFSGQPWLADRETNSANHRKLVQMGLVEQVCVERQTWRDTPLGKEVDIELFEVFIGLWDEWEVPLILEKHGLLTESEVDGTLVIPSPSPPQRQNQREHVPPLGGATRTY